MFRVDRKAGPVWFAKYRLPDGRQVQVQKRIRPAWTQRGRPAGWAGRDRWTTEDDLVFPGRLGHHLNGRALTRRYDRALDRAGLRRLRLHDLRHTFRTRTIPQGSPPRSRKGARCDARNHAGRGSGGLASPGVPLIVVSGSHADARFHAKVVARGSARTNERLSRESVLLLRAARGPSPQALRLSNASRCVHAPDGEA